MKTPAAVMLFVAVLASSGGKSAFADDNQLPEELRTLREQVGCTDVSEFYDRPGMVDPPYLYGIFPGPRDQSAAFWCQRGAIETKRPFFLVIVEQGRVTAKIPWHNPPGGLSLDDEARLPLAEFRYVDQPERKGPKGKSTKRRALHDEYDGNITLFYRLGNKWLFKLID